MPKTTVAEVLYLPAEAALRFLPEGPTALGVGKFSWVAIQHGPDATHGSLNIFDIATGTNQNFPLPGRPGFAKPTTEAGVFVVGCERQLGLFNTADGSWKPLVDGVDHDVEGTIINDGTLYAGNIVFGTKDLEFKTAKASLYLFRASDCSLTRLIGNQVCSNGKDVIDRGDGGLTLIDIDSPTRKVVSYSLDIDQGCLGEPELMIDLSDAPGVPDGMIMSPDEQSLIISFYNPEPAAYGETRQYSAYNGELEHVWRTPGAPQATCPQLVQLEDGSIKLLITTAVEHMPAERQDAAPKSGAIFIADTLFKSPPVTPHLPVKQIRGLQQ